MVVKDTSEPKPEIKGFSYYFNSHTNYGRANVKFKFSTFNVYDNVKVEIF